MTEEKINALRQADTNLRDALKMDEAELPQMPADLNERLMQRMAVEEKKPRRTIIWPWIAAACVAGVMMVWLKPPASPPAPLQEARGVVTPESQKVEVPKVAKVEMEVEKSAPTPTKVKKARGKTTVAKRDAALLAQETKAEEPVAKPVVDEVHKDLAVAILYGECLYIILFILIYQRNFYPSKLSHQF